MAINAFAALPVVNHLELSPNGNYLAFLQNLDGETVLVTMDLNGMNKHVVIKSDNEKYHIRGYGWVNDDRLLVRVGYTAHQQSLKIYQTRLLAVNRDGSELKGDLIRIADTAFDRRHFSQFQDRYALLPGDARHVLLSLDDRKPGTPEVYKLDVYTGDKEIVTHNPGYVREWLFDQKGRTRIGVGLLDTTKRIVYRTADDEDWQTLVEYDILKGDQMQPLGFDGDSGLLYFLSGHRGKTAVFRLDLSRPKHKPELVYADADYDVRGTLIYSANRDKVIGIRYQGDAWKQHYWNDTARQLQAAIDRAAPDRINSIVSSAGKQHIVRSSASTMAPVYYWMDEERLQMGELIDTYPQLKAETLASTQTVKFKAHDGLELEAYLTRPKSASGSGPVIVFPHGGPWSRDTKDFNPWTQFMVNRGWSVLQLNFRGSAGYGADFERAGFRRWGLEMQDDISDGVRWLIGQNIADAGKICIVGASYGGYAALMGAIKNPDLYRCAVSLAPVTDLPRLIEDWSDRRWRDHRLQAEIAEQRLGDWWSDSDRLKQTSPRYRAAALHTPLLLVHGVEDAVVNVEHSRVMASELESAGNRDFQYMELEQGDHALTREKDRLAFFNALDVFLRKYQVSLK